MTLENTNGLGQRYKAKILIPTGTLLAVYSGSLERVQPGEEDSLNHSMAQGKVDFQYDRCGKVTFRRPGPHFGLLDFDPDSFESESHLPPAFS